MRESFRETLLSLRELLFTAAPFVLLTIGLVALAYVLLDPTPPKQVTLATGQDQGAYAEFGKRYAQILKENGIEVRLRPTAGAAENLALLREPGGEVDIAFVQGGADATVTRSSADDADDRRPGLDRQPVPRAGLAVLSRRRGRAAAEDAGAHRAEPARRLAGQHRRPGKRRAQPDGPADGGQRARPPGADAAPGGADAGGRRPARGPHRRGRARLGARIADGADAAEDARASACSTSPRPRPTRAASRSSAR